MELLKFYMLVSLFDIIGTVSMSTLYNIRLKKEGYKEVKNNKSSLEKAKKIIKEGAVLLVPVFNIVIAVSIIISSFLDSKNYSLVKETLLKENKIYYDGKEKEEKKEEKIITQEPKQEKKVKRMTYEERIENLQREKDLLLKEIKDEVKIYTKTRK